MIYKLIIHIIFLLLLINSIPLRAQDYSISFCQQDTLITTETICCDNQLDDPLISIALQKTIGPCGIFYQLKIALSSSESFQIPNGARTYLVLDNDSVINLVIHHEANSTQEAVFFDSNILNKMVINAIYPIYHSDLIATFKGVKRIRMELNNRLFERFFSDDEIGLALQQLYHILESIKI